MKQYSRRAVSLGLVKTAAVASVFPSVVASAVMAAPKPITVDGEFDFEWTENNLTLKARDVTIQGLHLPALTWGWVGMAIAQGVLSGFGSMVFQALVGAARSQGADLGELLRLQLAEFARIVDQALKADALREYEATLRAYVRLFHEYTNDKTRSRLDFLLNESAVILSKIESLGFLGYRTYMSTAGLRLAVLQERAQSAGSGARKNFIHQREAAIGHHRAMIKVIDENTSPDRIAASVDQWEHGEQSPLGSVFMPDILGKPVRHRLYRLGERLLPYADCNAMGAFTYPVVIQGPPVGPFHIRMPITTTARQPLDCANLAAVATELKAENTDIGEKIVTRWQQSPSEVTLGHGRG